MLDETLHKSQVEAISQGRRDAAREGSKVFLHSPSCNFPPCTCIPYSVGPYDPRPTVLILEAAERGWRDH